MIKLINGNTQTAGGVAVPNGSITLQLTADATLIASPGQVVSAVPIRFKFDATGNLLGSCQIWSNAELSPQTQYQVFFYDQNGADISKPILWQFNNAAGATVDIGTMVAATTGGATIPAPLAIPPIYVNLTGDPCANIIAAMVANPGGADIVLPAGTGTCSQPSYTLPNNGAGGYPNQAAYTIRGVSADTGNAGQGSPKVINTGTMLSFTGTAPGSGCRFNTLGVGKLDIASIAFLETVGASPCLIETTNTRLKFHHNMVQGPTFAWITNLATRIQSTGGSSTLKYQLDLGASANGVFYSYFMFVKNQGATAVTVGGAFAGSTVTIQPGTTALLTQFGTGDGSTHIQMRFSTANVGDAMDVVAFDPLITPSNSHFGQLITGANATFQNSGGGTWAAQGGATPTITQSISVDQEPTYDAVLLGSPNLVTDGTVSSAFQGYPASIYENFFDRVRSAVVWGATANAANVYSNFISSFSGSTTQGAFDFSKAANQDSFGSNVSWNTIECLSYKYGVWVHNTSAGGGNPAAFNYFSNNQCFDAQDVFVSCYRFESGTNARSNTVVQPFVTPGSTFGQLITDLNAGTAAQATVISPVGNQFSPPLGYTQIADTTLSGSAATITFSSIPQIYKHLRIVVQARGDAAAAFVDCNIQFNGDTGANYDTEVLSGVNVTAAAANANGAVAGNTFSFPGTTVTRANLAGVGIIEIPNYAGTTFEKQVIASGGQADSTPANMGFFNRLSSWRNTAAISSITLKTSSGNFVAGTRATLYGMN